MKSIREKMAAKESLTWSEWSALVAIKFFAISISFGAIVGTAMLAINPTLSAIYQANYFQVLVYSLCAIAALEGSLNMAKRVHDRLLS